MKNEGRKEKVAIVRCNSYRQKQVDKAIRKVLKLLEFDKDKYKKVLIKPNVLGSYKENQEAITTNPALVRALIKEIKGRQKIGESSFMDTKNSFKKAGYNFKGLVIFEQRKLIKIKDNKAKILKSFYLPKIIKQADLIVNVPKLKTHTLTKMTGAIKNLYGCIPGGLKQLYHKKAKGDEKFSELLVDIYQNIKPALNIMDAVVAMEGEGPSSGKPRKVGLILASKNAVALDIVASRLIGFNPGEILAIREAERRFGKIKIEIVGEVVKNFRFKKPLSYKKKIARKMLKELVEKKIVCDSKICTRCGNCMKHCPMKAISMSPYPEINKKKCIRCFCCIEICPTNAMHLEKSRK